MVDLADQRNVPQEQQGANQVQRLTGFLVLLPDHQWSNRGELKKQDSSLTITIRLVVKLKIRPRTERGIYSAKSAILIRADACVGQTFLSAGSGDIRVARTGHGTGKPHKLAGSKARLNLMAFPVKSANRNWNAELLHFNPIELLR
jgi:hypothetical protein